MKKIALLTAIVLVILSLTGCIKKSVSYATLKDTPEISLITVYECTTSGEKELVGAVNGDDFASLTKDLSAAGFKKVAFVLGAIDFISPYTGYMLRIVYNDGQTEDISAYGQVINGETDGQKVTHLFCDEDEWIELIEKYVDITE